MSDGYDRRVFKRARVNLTVIYRLNEPLAVRLVVRGQEVEATMLDLSEGGVALLTKYNIPISTAITIRFTLFKADKDDVSFYGPVDIVGEVRYNASLSEGEYRLGIAFIRMEEKDKQEIRNFVNRAIDLLKPGEQW